MLKNSAIMKIGITKINYIALKTVIYKMLVVISCCAAC